MPDLCFYAPWIMKEPIPDPFRMMLEKAGKKRISYDEADCSMRNIRKQGKVSRLHGPTLHALLTLIQIRKEKDSGAAGIQRGRDAINYFCMEYPGNQGKYVMTYNSKNGRFSGILKTEEKNEKLPGIREGKNTGEQYLALLAYANLVPDNPLFNEEFQKNFYILEEQEKKEWEDTETALRAAFICCDAMYCEVIANPQQAIPLEKSQFRAEELEDEADFDLLEERLINYPALAIAQCHRAMNGMSKKLRKNVNRAMNLLNDYQQDKYDKVQRKEDLIDKYESRLGEYLIQLTKREMNTAQTTQVSLYLHTINDFERIGDHASYIAHMANEMHDNHTQFSQAAWDELNIVMEAVREEINVTCNAFMKDDKEAAQRVAPLGAVITNLCDELKMHHVERLSKGECGLEEGTVFNDILNSFGRIAAHSASAMTALLKSGDTDADPHIHDSKIYPTDSWEYYTYFNEYRQKYDVIANAEHVLSMEPEEVE